MGKLMILAETATKYYQEFGEALRDYEEGRERIYAVERLAQLLAQVILDYAAILASRSRGEKPGTYKELARFLAHHLKLDETHTKFLEELAGFRNVLVHMYSDIDIEQELEAFHEILEKAPLILQRMREYAQGDPCLEEVAPRIRTVARKLGFRYVLVFGSLARRGCGRDIDLAVKLGRKPRSMLEVGGIQVTLEHELAAPVDLVIIDILSDPALAKTLVDEAILIYGDPGEAEEDLLRLYKMYLEHIESRKKTLTTSTR